MLEGALQGVAHQPPQLRLQVQELLAAALAIRPHPFRGLLADVDAVGAHARDALERRHHTAADAEHVVVQQLHPVPPAQLGELLAGVDHVRVGPGQRHLDARAVLHHQHAQVAAAAHVAAADARAAALQAQLSGRAHPGSRAHHVVGVGLPVAIDLAGDHGRVVALLLVGVPRRPLARVVAPVELEQARRACRAVALAVERAPHRARVDGADLDDAVAVLAERRVHQLGALNERSLVEEVHGAAAAAADLVAGLAGDGGAGFRVDDAHGGRVARGVEAARQQLGRQVAQVDADLLEDAVRVADAVHQQRLARADAHLGAGHEQPQPGREVVDQPCDAEVARLLDLPVLAAQVALVHPLNALRLAREGHEGHQRGLAARVKRHAPVADEQQRVAGVRGAVELHQLRVRADLVKPLLALAPDLPVVRRPSGLTGRGVRAGRAWPGSALRALRP